MNLYIKQKVFSWKDKFRVYDENGQDLYYAEGKVFSLGKKLTVFDAAGTELAFIHEKIFSLLPKYFISQNGVDIAQVQKKLTFFHPEYEVIGLGWQVKGNFLEHEYQITDTLGQTAVTVSKRWFTWGDTYEVHTENSADALMALCVVLIIDAVVAQQNSAANTAAIQ